MQLQTQANKLAEIKYRQKISVQHTGKKVFFKNEPNQKEIQLVLKKRLEQYKDDFKNLNLKESTLIKSPFLEIGAEYAIASSYLRNKYKTNGIACDLSFYSLKKAKYFAKTFKLKKIPTLVCADANCLPFKSNSIPFIFVYESLHHFPHPKPILKEIYRVLAPGGTLFIGSEPIKQGFQIKLWRRPNKLRTWEKALKAVLILPFISHIGKSEVDYGILEEAFPLKTWLKSLSTFDSFEAQIEIPYINLTKKITKDKKSTFPMSLILNLTGGGIRAICKKAQGKPSNITLKQPVFICPNCLDSKEIELKNLSCPRCKNTFFKKSGIPILLKGRTAQKIA